MPSQEIRLSPQQRRAAQTEQLGLKVEDRRVRGGPVTPYSSGIGQNGRGAFSLLLALLLLIATGCAPTSRRTRTVVTGKLEPRHFQFYTIVDNTENEPGGWRAACVHLTIQRKNTGESFVCTFGIEVPMANDDMPISIPLAQRISAQRTDEVARLVFGAATPASPLGLLCEAFKKTLRARLKASISGSRLDTVCREEAIPVQFGEFTH